MSVANVDALVVLPVLLLAAGVPPVLAGVAVLAALPLVPPRPSTVDAATPARDDLVAMPATCSRDCKMLPNKPCVESVLDDAPAPFEPVAALPDAAPEELVPWARFGLPWLKISRFCWAAADAAAVLAIDMIMFPLEVIWS